MNSVRWFIVMLFALVLSVGTSIAVAIKGWGLEPKSWGWIIGVYLIGHIVSQLIMEIGTHDDK